jgi:hypothetical protein
MNTVFLVIWLQVNGTNAMVQQPMGVEQCYRAAGHITNATAVKCYGETEAAQAIYDGGCELVETVNTQDRYICNRGFKS